MNSNSKSDVITLENGDKLSYAEFGDLNGVPVVHFPGTAMSRLDGLALQEQAIKHKIRLICVDRPGIGNSDFRKDFKILNWPDYIISLVNSLNIENFAVQGVSGGGPYALACSYLLTDRLIACNVISGMVPIKFGMKGMVRENKLIFFVARRLPWLLGFFMKAQSGMVKKRERIEEQFQKQKSQVPALDAKLMDDPEFVSIFIDSLQEAVRQGSKGVILEFKLFTKYWGFNLKDIPNNLTIHLWHGNEDKSVPISLVQAMSKEIPNCETHFFPNEGHTTIYHHIHEIFEIINQATDS